MIGMGLTFNGYSDFDSITYNGNELEVLQYNGNEIWRRIKYVAVPTLSATSFSTKGSTVGPTVRGFDSTIMTQSGTTSTNTPGTYTVTWALKDTKKYCWADGSTGTKTATWTVTGATIAFYVQFHTSKYQSSGGSDYHYWTTLTFKVPYGKTFGGLGNKTYYETSGATCQIGGMTGQYNKFTLGTDSSGVPNIWTATTESSTLKTGPKICTSISSGASPYGIGAVATTDYPSEGTTYYACIRST